MQKKNKISFFKKHAKWFLFATSFVLIFGLACLAVIVGEQKLARGTSKADSQASLVSSSASKVFYPDLNKGVGVYVLSKERVPCRDFQNTTLKNVFGFRCKTENAIWRGFWVKEIDVAGYNQLRIEADLGVKDYSGSFAQCDEKGVNRENAVDLIVFSSDPSVKWNRECNHEVGEDKWWDHCLVTNKAPSAITHCGIPQCTLNRGCDMDIEILGRDAVYMLFAVHDDWFADVEGVLSDMKITLTK